MKPGPEKFASVGKVRLHYGVRGNWPAVVLVHGLLGHAFSWRYNLEPLAQHFRLYAIDLPGSGYSEPSPHYACSASAAAGLIREFATAVSEREIFLAGHSAGAAAALLCAAHYPKLVRALVLIAPVHPFCRRGLMRIRLGGVPVVGRCLLAAARCGARPLAKFLLRHRLYADPARVDAGTVDAYLAPLLRPGVSAVLRRTLAAWDLRALRSALPQVRQPVLLIWGERDLVIPAASARALASALDARMEIVPGCGHLPAEEAPAAVNHLIVEFLTTQPAIGLKSQADPVTSSGLVSW